MELGTLREVMTSLYEATPDAVILFDRHGAAIAANDAALGLTGYAPDEVCDATVADFVAPSDVERVRMAVQSALKGRSDHFDVYLRQKNESAVPMECYIFPARSGDEIAGVFLQGRDVAALHSAEESLTINQQKFRSLFEYHPDGIMELKSDGAISRVNVALESETGFYGEQLVGLAWTEMIAPECRTDAEGALHDAMRGEATELDSHLLDRLGNRIDVQLKLVPLHGGLELRGAYAIFKNVTLQKKAERDIEAQREQIRRLYMVAASRGASLDAQIDAALCLGLELFRWEQGYVTRFDEDRTFVRSAVGGNTVAKGSIFPLALAFSRHVLHDREQLFIADLDDSEYRDDPARDAVPWRSYFAIRLSVFDKPYGALVFASRAQRFNMDTSERDLVQLMGLFVSAALERAQQNERIEQLAFNDPLTGLPNRTRFNDRIEHTLATSRRYGRGFAVMYVDVDRFKAINDEFGHATGDAVLKVVAERLRASLRESDTVSRFGGDEFVILQPVVDGPGDAADLARKLNVAMQQPVVLDGRAHEVRISIGIALYPGDGATIDSLMESADRALYRAKNEGRNRWCFANAALAARLFQRAGAALRNEMR